MCAWDEFSEYLLENRVPTSADFNTYLYEFFSQNSAFTFINCYILKIFHRNWIESNIVDTYGYGIPSMDVTAAPSLCNSDGTTDIIPTGMSMFLVVL